MSENHTQSEVDHLQQQHLFHESLLTVATQAPNTSTPQVTPDFPGSSTSMTESIMNPFERGGTTFPPHHESFAVGDRNN